jgi:hypothetical protein
MRGDLQVIGFAQTLPRRIAASTTRFYAGEPLHSVATLSSGVSSDNVYVPAAADTPVIGTHRFGGIANTPGPLPLPTGTVVACTVNSSNPVPNVGIIRGKGETFTAVDTDTEILGLIGDVTLIDYNATGGVGSTPLYTIKSVASADTSGLEIVAGNPTKGTLDVVIDTRGYRHDVS